MVYYIQVIHHWTNGALVNCDQLLLRETVLLQVEKDPETPPELFPTVPMGACTDALLVYWRRVKPRTFMVSEGG